jgi:undecaprenyl diphosphate synthase
MTEDSTNSVAQASDDDSPAPPARAPDAAGISSIAIIMDGSGRWAAGRGVSVAEGHREGARALRRTVEAAIELGVESLAVYAFSTENWARPPDEVESLLELLDETIDRELPDLARQGVRTRFVGRRDRIPEHLQRKMETLEAETAGNDTLLLWIAFDYGSRAELVQAVQRLIEDGVAPEDVSEQTLAQRLYAPELPDPDLVIRTSGEQRISNFLLWQSAYSEFVFMDTLWPDFDAGQLQAAVDEFARRQRRFGGR